MPVYIMREGDTDRVKIGWSRDPEKRRRDFQTHHHSPLTIIRIIEGPQRTEAWMQHRFADRRINREWFTFCAEMLAVEPVLSDPPPGLGARERDPGLVLALNSRMALTKIAKALGVSRAAISQWTRVPAERVLVVEEITGVPCEKLRPDLYPSTPPPGGPVGLPVRSIDAHMTKVGAALALLRAGWEPRRVGVALGMERSFAIAAHWLRPDLFPESEAAN